LKRIDEQEEMFKSAAQPKYLWLGYMKG